MGTKEKIPKAVKKDGKNYCSKCGGSIKSFKTGLKLNLCNSCGTPHSINK